MEKPRKQEVTVREYDARRDDLSKLVKGVRPAPAETEGEAASAAA